MGLIFATGLFATRVPAAAQAPDLRHGEVLADDCTSCHGLQGRGGATIPALAGADRAALLTTMTDLRNQKGSATIMKRLLRGYSDDELRALADYFSHEAPR